MLAFALFLLFGFAMIWVGILVGSTFKSVEARAGLHVHGDVPADVPGQHLRADREHADLAAHDRRVEPGLGAHPGRRELWGNGPVAGPDAALPLQYPVLFTIGWSLLITAVFAPLALGRSGAVPRLTSTAACSR